MFSRRRRRWTWFIEISKDIWPPVTASKICSFPLRVVDEHLCLRYVWSERFSIFYSTVFLRIDASHRKAISTQCNIHEKFRTWNTKKTEIHLSVVTRILAGMYTRRVKKWRHFFRTFHPTVVACREHPVLAKRNDMIWIFLRGKEVHSLQRKKSSKNTLETPV